MFLPMTILFDSRNSSIAFTTCYRTCMNYDKSLDVANKGNLLKINFFFSKSHIHFFLSNIAVA